MSASWFAARPPAVVALASLVWIGAWQLVGHALMGRALRAAGLPARWALPAAWTLWLPVSGAAVLALALVGAATRGSLLGLEAAAALAAAVLAWRERRAARDAGAGRGRDARRGRPLLVLAAALALLVLVYAAHPQRVYDQLNYHLVLAKRLLLFGDPMRAALESHLAIAGPVEYAFALPRALFADDFFEHAAAQAWVFVAVAGGFWLAARAMWEALGAEDRPGLVALAVLLFPAVLPASELARMAKPDGVLLALAAVALAAAFDRSVRWVPLAAGLALVAFACKQTFAPAALALVAVAALPAMRRGGEGPRPPWLPLAGAALLALVVAKNLRFAGSPLYPADARFFPSDLADEQTAWYWWSVATWRETGYLRRLPGALLVPAQTIGLLALPAGLAALAAAQRRLVPALRANRGYLALGGFLVAYALAWPFFFHARIYPRFVAPYLGALALLACALLPLVAGRARALAVLGVLAASLSFCGADAMAARLWRWNRGTAFAAMAGEFPGLRAQAFLNERLQPEDLVASNEPQRYHLNAILLHGTLTPRQRAVWAELLARPREAARERRLKAVVLAPAAPDPNTGRYPDEVALPQRLWDALAAHGRTTTIDGRRVLWSDCSFAARPCPGETLAQP